MAKDTFTIEITKKDKVYLSLIFVLVCAIICMAICLPRPYKFIEKEVIVYEPKHMKVYDTKHHHIISATSHLYNSEIGYYEDAFGNKFVLSFKETYVGTGSLESIYVSVVTNENGIDVKTPILLENAMNELFVLDQTENGFGVEVDLDYFLMLNVKNMFVTNLGKDKIGVMHNYLFELKFQHAEINIIVTFLSE